MGLHKLNFQCSFGAIVLKVFIYFYSMILNCVFNSADRAFHCRVMMIRVSPPDIDLITVPIKPQAFSRHCDKHGHPHGYQGHCYKYEYVNA